MKYKGIELSEVFEGTPPLIPEGWNEFLWLDESFYEEAIERGDLELGHPQCDPETLPEKGQLVALLHDLRINPSEALNADLCNRIKLEPSGGGVIGEILYAMFTRKRKIRWVTLARYFGVDKHGLPEFQKFQTDEEDNDYIVAWKAIDIPNVEDIILDRSSL